MPDIQFFDATGFVNQKINEVEQNLIAKKAELEILYANRRNLDSTIATLGLLPAEHQRAIQTELASLKEVLNATERAIGALEGEVEVLSNKLAALQAARRLIQVKESP